MSIQIFLAYASEDQHSVIDLYERLKEKGYNPWLDKRDLMPGQNWREEIPRAIRNSQIFIACLSQQSVSKQGYIQRELRMALNEYAEKPPGSIYLIPLKLDDCQVPDLRLEQLGVGLQDLQWLDYWESGGLSNLLNAIEHQFGKLGAREPSFPPSSPTPDPTTFPITRNGRAFNNATQRLTLFQKLAKLPGPQFEQLIFSLNPPAGNVPSAQAAQSDRVKALLDWADNANNIGLLHVESIYRRVVNPQ